MTIHELEDGRLVFEEPDYTVCNLLKEYKSIKDVINALKEEDLDLEQTKEELQYVLDMEVENIYCRREDYTEKREKGFKLLKEAKSEEKLIKKSETNAKLISVELNKIQHEIDIMNKEIEEEIEEEIGIFEDI